jgi:hypothetical protein
MMRQRAHKSFVCLPGAGRADTQLIMRMTTRTAASALALLAASTAMAQTGPDLLLGTFREGNEYALNGSATLAATGTSDNGGADFSLYTYEAQGRMALNLDALVSGLNRAQPRAGFDLVLLEIDDDAGVIPGNLMDASVAFGMGVFANEKWLAGITVGVGYAGAEAFRDGDAWYGKADFAVGYAINDNERIGVVVNYDGNRTFLPDVPLVGLQYFRKIDDRLSLSVGFPFSDITWTPDDQWRITLTYVIPDFAELDAEYRFTPNLGVYGRFFRQNRAFHSDDFGGNLDRLIVQQTRAELGVRGTINDTFRFSVAGGYAFGQHFEVGFDSRDAEEIADISDEPYVRFGIEAEF